MSDPPASHARRACRDEESPFTDEELFFSRTDPHGVLKSGNDVFQRVSCYDWDELIGRPHKIIRHPDTPRAVFWLLWDAIGRGEPVGAYVKNRAKNGCYYWVFAIVTPVEGGFLSVRLKPGGDLFALVREVYRECVEAEAAERLDPALSAGRLLDRLSGLGYGGYADFQAAALSAELRERDARLQRPVDGALSRFGQIVQASGALLGPADAIAEAYRRGAYLPLNLRIQASQYGAAGAAVGAISGNYGAISDELGHSVERFAAAAREVRRSVDQGLFLLGAARIQGEMSEIFGRQAPAHGADAAAEIRLLDAQRRAYAAKAQDGLHAILRQADAFRSHCAEMSRLAAGLEVTRIMGEVERAGLPGQGDALEKLLEELGAFQRTLADALRELGRRNAEIAAATGKVMELGGRAPPQ